MSEYFWITDDGIRLHAALDRPGNDRCPLAIIIHGFTGNKDERHLLAVSEALNRLGVATLRVDMYGHGQSDGRFHDHTLFKWLTNALTIIDYARSLDFVTDLYLGGHSQGGLTAMLAGAMAGDYLRGLLLLSPAAMIPDDARNGVILGTQIDPLHIPKEIPISDEYTLGGNYIRVAQMIDVNIAIDRYTGPALLIHGVADDTVPVQVGIDAARRYRQCELALIPGETHCYDCHLDQVVDAVTAWMQANIKETAKTDTIDKAQK